MSNRLNDGNVWPWPVLSGIPLRSITSHYNPPDLPYFTYPQQVINYLLYICRRKHLSPRSFQGTLIVSTRYLTKTSSLQSLQLIILVSLMLVTKLYDYYCLTVGEIHQVSNHRFTTKQINQMEAKMLLALEFNLFDCYEGKMTVQEQRGNVLSTTGHYNQNDNSTTYESVYTLLIVITEMTKDLLPQHKHSFYYDMVNKVFHLYLHLLYTKQFKKKALQKLSNPKYMICVIVKISLIALTQYNGPFPQIQWVMNIFKLKDNYHDHKKFDQEFEEIVVKILHLIFGKQFETLQNQIKPFHIRN